MRAFTLIPFTEISPDVLQVSELYKEFVSTTSPLVNTIRMFSEDPLMDSGFGKVKAGSPVIIPAETTCNIIHCQDPTSDTS